MEGPGVAGAVLAGVAAGLGAMGGGPGRGIGPLTERAEPAPPESDASRRALLRALITTVREPLLLHREHIEAANAGFCALVGLPAEQVVGRRLSELVAPAYAGLVEAQLRRQQSGEPLAELLEVEVADPRGQISRLELKCIAVELDGERHALFSAIDMLPAQRAKPALAAPRARTQLAFDALGEGLVITGPQGHVDYVNPTAAALLGVDAQQAEGRQLTDLAGFVDEQDRRPLPDPIRQCLTSGVVVSLGRRAVLVPRNGEERHVELSAAPMRGESGELVGVAAVLHDVTELRGLARQMTYQASHDALTGLANRREFERRLGDALEASRGGRGSPGGCDPGPRPLQAGNDTGPPPARGQPPPASAATSSASCWSAARSRRPGRSPRTSAAPSTTTGSCGRTGSSASA